MDIRALTKDMKVCPILSYASGTADRKSVVIDHLGFHRCCILTGFGTIAAGGANSIFLQHADAAIDQNTLTSGADVATSLQTIIDTDDNNWKFMDYLPSKRFSQLNIDKDTSNACAEWAVAILYNGEVSPTTLVGGTSAIGDGSGTMAGEYIGLAVSGTK